VFVWMLDGRPEVIGSIFTYRLLNDTPQHEYHSLAAAIDCPNFAAARVGAQGRGRRVSSSRTPEPAATARIEALQISPPPSLGADEDLKDRSRTCG